MRIALGIEYDGSRFLGWQTQPGGGSVQDALEQALAGIAGSPVASTCAGRTDRGVHARAQVVHFDTDAERPESAWVICSKQIDVTVYDLPTAVSRRTSQSILRF